MVIKCVCVSVEDVWWWDVCVEVLDVWRIKGLKSFYGARASVAGVLNFNYNVLYEGDYVVLVSEMYVVVGVDVVVLG